MYRQDNITVHELASTLELSDSTIRRWIRQGKLKAEQRGGKYIIDQGRNIGFIVQEIKKRPGRPRKVWVPSGIRRYNQWHEILDEFCWLLKITYANTSEIKEKKFRLDQIFANYFISNKVDLSKLKRIFSTNLSPDVGLITNDLKRGWYNELSYAIPMRVSTPGLSFSDIAVNKEISDIRFAFPSWRIISAYYAVYFYLRAVTLQKEGNYRLQEHQATISMFKHHVISPLESVIWKFPFNISNAPSIRDHRLKLLREVIPHGKFNYAKHPRTPNRSPFEIVAHVKRVYRANARKRPKPSVYTLFDFLHDFRIWSNYLDIGNLVCGEQVTKLSSIRICQLWPSSLAAFLSSVTSHHLGRASS